MRIATIGLAGCSGCHVALVSLHEKLLELLEKANLVHSYMLLDEKEIPEDVDLGFIEGAVRTAHDEEKTRDLRSKSKTLVSLGSCSCFGGLPGLGNIYDAETLLNEVYTNTASTVDGFVPYKDLPKVLPSARPVDEVVKVDYKLPGCPPEVESIADFLIAFVKGERPKAHLKNVCEECPRERRGHAPQQYQRIHTGKPEPELCLLEQGYICMGPATRNGCGAKCPKANMTCEGCYGPCENAWDQGLAMLDALTAMTTDALPDFKMETHSAIFYRYTFASSLLSKIARKRR